MLICYVDESGTPDPGGNSSHFVLLGLALQTQRWKIYDQAVSAINAQYDLVGREIHTAFMLRRYRAQDEIQGFEQLSRKERRRAVRNIRYNMLARARRRQLKELNRTFKRTDEYIHLTLAERQECIRKLADLLGSWESAVLFADAQHKAKILQTPDRCFEYAFEQVVTRLNTHIRRDYGDDCHAIVVQDNNATHEERLVKLMGDFHLDGTAWNSEISQVVEAPMFVDSRLTSMLQMADLAAYATRRFFERRETDLFDRIYSRFDRAHGRLVGLRHYTGPQRCECRVCVDHGR